MQLTQTLQSLTKDALIFIRRPINVHFGLQAFSQGKIVCTNLKPAIWLLVEVEAAADLDHPSGIETDLAVVKIRIERYLQFDIHFEKALF